MEGFDRHTGTAEPCATVLLPELHACEPSLAPLPAGEVPPDLQRAIFPSEAWTDQLKKLLDVLRRMGLLGHVLRTSHVTAPLSYVVSRTAAVEQPPSGAPASLLLGLGPRP